VKAVVVEHIGSLWLSLRREVLAAPTDSIEEVAIKALTAVTYLLASGPHQGLFLFIFLPTTPIILRFYSLHTEGTKFGIEKMKIRFSAKFRFF
jgi:hypothetical protein